MTINESESITRLEEKVDKIVRGLYGDKENGIKGLIDRQRDDEEWRKVYAPLLMDYKEHAPKLKKIINEREFAGKYFWYAAAGLVGSILLILSKLDILTF